MQEHQFWEIIELLNVQNLKKSIKLLSECSESDIFDFENILSEKLFQLDTQKHAEAFGNKTDEYFSVDNFLYQRCFVVQQGIEFYKRFLMNPFAIPENNTFEPLLYISEKAYKLKTGNDNFVPVSSFSYETYSNTKGWKINSVVL